MEKIDTVKYILYVGT